MRPRMTMYRQKSTKREKIPEGPPVDEELYKRCQNVHDFYKKNDPGYILKDTYYPKTIEELRKIIREN